MRWREINETHTPEITRWVDPKAARHYIRNDAMIGRVRHWLPKQISGLDKIYPKTGLSFGIPGSGSNWNAHGNNGICFIVSRDRLSNLVCDIDGQAVFEFSGDYDAYRMGAGTSWDYLANARERAIRDSQEHPDEAFVVGNIRDLHTVLERIEIGSEVDAKTAQLVREYAEQHGITVS